MDPASCCPNAFPEPALVDAATDCFFAMIADRRRNGNAGDRKARRQRPDLERAGKTCLRDPALFARYYANTAIALVSEAWLGPSYQITSQINVVNPAARRNRRTATTTWGSRPPTCWPTPRPCPSPVAGLTLQGPVAHCDMPIETGPTLYLPFSQTYELGYLARRRPEFIEYFDKHRIELPLAKGDAVFFNPALFHAAGSNRTATVKRIANLLQVSSAYGRAMESVDRTRMSAALYPALLALGKNSVDDAPTPSLPAPKAIRSPPTSRDPPLDELRGAAGQLMTRRWPKSGRDGVQRGGGESNPGDV